jgi:hypothetical protein
MSEVKKLDKTEILPYLAKKYKNVAIIVPTYKIIPAYFIQSFFVTIQYLNRAGFNPRLYFCDNTNVCRARNTLAGNFIKDYRKNKECNIVWWIDSDHTFGVSDFLDLLYSLDYFDVDIMSGRYVTRDVVAPRVCGFVWNKEKEHYQALDPTMTGVCEVDSFGFGFNIMKPEVLDKMYDAHGEHQFLFVPKGDKFEGQIIGEDMDWCMKAKALGYKLHFNNDVQVGHIGGIIDEDYLKMTLEKKYGYKYSK